MARIGNDNHPRGRCPICQAPAEAAFRPFCSRRCADVDLSRWLRGAYAIPVQSDDDEDGENEDGGTPSGSDGPGQPGVKEL